MNSTVLVIKHTLLRANGALHILAPFIISHCVSYFVPCCSSPLLYSCNEVYYNYREATFNSASAIHFSCPYSHVLW